MTGRDFAASRGAVRCISWKADAMAALASLLWDSPHPLHEHLIIMPHRRPRRYLLQAIAARLPKGSPPVRPPRILAAGEWLSQLRAELPLLPTQTVSLLDRVHLLQEVVNRTQSHSLGPVSHISAETFFPWGLRLDSLMEEYFLAARRPQAMEHLEDAVLPFAGSLLGALDRIHDDYVRTLEERGWSTPGLDAFQVAAHLEVAATLIQEPQVLFVGFDDCSGVEEMLFRHLWEQGRADLILHADPALASGMEGTGHWSQGHIREFLSQWGIKEIDLVEAPECETCPATPVIYEGYDLHSQLAALSANLRQDVAEQGHLDGTAIVIAEPNMLMPVLHHLPLDAVDVNVSLGYPLQRSNLAQLLEQCMVLQETAASRGVYHWRELLGLIRHPYLKMLVLENPSEQEAGTNESDPEPEQVLRPLFHRLERALRQGSPMRQRSELSSLVLNGLEEDANPAHTAFMERLLGAFLTAWEQPATLGQLADVLHACCELLLTHGMALWQRFPVDGECLHRLLHQVLPALSGCTMRDEPAPSSLQFAILRALLQAERVPFEADPLTGLQVLGMLESRLLPFSRVHILGVTDDVVPGQPGFDPLLPDALRSLQGLPDGWRKERRQAAVFFRCLEGSARPRLYTQTGATSSGLLDEKKRRSRFVEEAIWKEEQRRGELLTVGEAPLHRIQFPAVSLPQERHGVPATPALKALLGDLLSRPISPTFLDQYIRCPARFAHERLLRLEPQETVREEGDLAAVGDIVHQTLHAYFDERRERLLTSDDIDGDALGDLFASIFAANPVAEAFRFDHRTATALAGRKRLKDYAAAFPETTILALEAPLTGQLGVGGCDYSLRGVMDRLDQREGKDDITFHIIDYKTGSVRLPRRRFWEGDHWEAMAAWHGDMPDAASHGEGLLTLLQEELKSVQLPFYLYCAATHPPVHLARSSPENLEASLVELAKGGKERMLLGAKLDATQRREIITELVPILLVFLLRHMTQSSIYSALQSAGCRHCPVQGGCLSQRTTLG